MPEALVTTTAGETGPIALPAPLGVVRVNVTLTPATGLSPSVTSTAGGVATAVPTVPVVDGEPDAAIVVAAAAVAVALNVTGLPAREPDVAVSVFAPAAAPSVQLPTVAMPLPFVEAAPPVTLPPPPVTAKVTDVPAITALLNWSRTSTDGGVATAVPTVAD